MTVLLYDLYELEERASRHLKAWKAWHLVMYALAATFGIINYVFLLNTMALVDDHCVLNPIRLEFYLVNLSQISESRNDVGVLTEPPSESATSNNSTGTGAQSNSPAGQDFTDKTQPEIAKTKKYVNTKLATTTENPTAVVAQSNSTAVKDNSVVEKDQTVKREAIDFNVTTQAPEAPDEINETVFTGNLSHHLVLHTSRTLFSNECEFAMYMPIMSTVFACVWATMFTMCAGGGKARSGLQQPWRILAPALVFAAVMVGLTGHSFTVTIGGLNAFCAGFSNLTNSTACSSVHQYLELGRDSVWTMGARISATRAASAGVWASWACAAALLLARCLAAPDFQVKKTGAYLVKDPQQKITQHLKKQRRSQRSNQSSPTKQDTTSVRSDPTITTELVTASVEQGQDSLPSSFTATPVRTPRNQEMIEMTYSPQERHID